MACSISAGSNLVTFFQEAVDSFPILFRARIYLNNILYM